MKTFTLIIFLFFSGFSVNAQDYLINFSGTGSSTSVETVTVENLTQGKSITLSGSKNIHLMETVTANTPLLEYMDYPLIVYPNPSSGDLTIQFETQKSGLAIIVLVDITGREINRIQQRVQNGFQSFKVEGLSNGVYTVQVLLEDQSFSKKVICNGKSTSKTTITYNGFSGVEQSITILKSANSEQSWQYNTGDRLKFKGTSGKYSTIVMDVPTQNKTISYEFVECTDADGNNYPVVQIGNQLWMAENLKTTKYNDGTLIPNVTDNTNWMNLSTGAYCWYNNDIINKKTYGALYNWFAFSTNKLTPDGWHIPTNYEWSKLTAFIGGETIGGAKLKETSTKYWAAPNSGATNEVGFTALPSGIRLVDKQNSFLGDFSILGCFCYWWSSELDNSDLWAYGKELGFNSPNIFRVSRSKQTGCSVRCIKDVPKKPSTKFVSRAPINTYPNSTIGQIKRGYFFPGFYDVNEANKYSILVNGTNNKGETSIIGSYSMWGNNSTYIDIENDGILDYFYFLVLNSEGQIAKNFGKYGIVKNVLGEIPIITNYDCTTKWSPTFEINDVNNDGYNEIIQASWDGHEQYADGSRNPESPLKIIYFNSNGTYNVKEIGEPMAIHDFASGDIDSDGDVDILVWATSMINGVPQPLLYINDGKGNFTLTNNYSTFSGLEEILKQYRQYTTTTTELFDLNNDGYLDIISGYDIGKIYSTQDYEIGNCRIYWGNSKGTFDFKNNFSDLPNTSIIDVSVPNIVLGFSFFDFDADGDYDVITTVTPDYGGFYIQLYENLGNGKFKDVTESKITGFSHVHPRNNFQSGDFPNFYNIRLYDIDNDGDYDLVPDDLAMSPFEIVQNLYWENIGGSFVRKNY
ncbi:major paralogous domain protein [Aquipluma nitroreducens]|uniref:Major paralogous domain protein n=1 Tax=Aquipluma nitroreducens TaxID=2010828 RepID=A0A5K7SBA9_9BACT|nr:FISUMP domain-containing protein [Aquipluma nitroreducens]BBE18584.1 major paralogous domain protein [Aquipluma nitroreducens]